jgi:hypothetical protein
MPFPSFGAGRLGLDRQREWYSMDCHFCPANDAGFLLARIPSRVALTRTPLYVIPARGNPANGSGAVNAMPLATALCMSA